MAGFVYVLGNPSMPGLLKVGMTQRTPELRAGELSASTSVPERFELMAYFLCDNPRMNERFVHDCLRDFRVSERREFFRCPMWAMYWGVEGCDGFITNAGVHQLTSDLINWISAGNKPDEGQYHFCGHLRARDWDFVRSFVSYKTGVDFDSWMRSFYEEERNA